MIILTSKKKINQYMYKQFLELTFSFRAWLYVLTLHSGPDALCWPDGNGQGVWL